MPGLRFDNRQFRAARVGKQWAGRPTSWAALLIVAGTAAAQAPERQACLGCHAGLAAVLRSGSAHPALEAGCGSCHPADRQTAPQPRICLGCHAPAGLSRTHFGVPVEQSTCSRCHDPHAAKGRKLLYPNAHGPFAGRRCDECHEAGGIALVVSPVNDLCYGCHVELKNRVASAAWRHRPLETGACTDCHTPHTSNYEKHLRKPVAALCGTCHAALPAAHPRSGLACTACHPAHAGPRSWHEPAR